MAYTNSDRRRFFLATTITLLALPALWWASKSDGGPNVATVGIAVADASSSDAADTVEPSTPVPGPQTATAEPEVTEPPPVFLDGPSGQVGAGVAKIAVPATTDERITTKATFRSDLMPTATCIVPGFSNGQRVVVVNLDNGRSVNCTTALAPFGTDHMVMSSTLFLQIADPTDAPIPVEIRR